MKNKFILNSKKKILNINDFERGVIKTNYENNIWFFGDSLTKGSGCLNPKFGNDKEENLFFLHYPNVNNEMTWTSIISNHYQLNKKNYGFGGASPDLVLNIFTNFLSDFKYGDKIILQIPYITRGFFFNNQNEYSHFTSPFDNLYPMLSDEDLSILKKYYIRFKEEKWNEWVGYYTELFLDFVNYFKKQNIDIFIWNGDISQKYETIINFTNKKIEDFHWSWIGHQQFANEIIKQIESGNYYNENNTLIYKDVKSKKRYI